MEVKDVTLHNESRYITLKNTKKNYGFHFKGYTSPLEIGTTLFEIK